MRWTRGRGADQIEDRRGQGMGGGLPIPGGAAGAGLGGLGLVGVIVVLLFSVLSGGQGGGLGIPGLEPLPPSPGAQAGGGLTTDADDDLRQFVGFVVDDVQDTWTGIFRSAGRAYQPTTLVLFSGGTVSGCGRVVGDGPFYCPRDGKVYLDLGFFRELRSRFGAPGDFAQAYVIAHEFGHHVQNLLGINEEVQRGQQQNPGERERALGPARAAGRLPRRRLGAFGRTARTCSSPATWRKASRPLRPSATTGSRPRPRAVSIPRAGRTDRRSSARPGSGGGSTPGTRTDATRSRATSEVDDELDPRVIVDFDFERGLLFVAVRNLGDRPAYRVSTTFDKPFRGLGGRREMNALRLFRGIEFLAPRRRSARSSTRAPPTSRARSPPS